MPDLFLLIILCFALYRMAEGHRITPWKWVSRYLTMFTATVLGLSVVLYAIYGPALSKDPQVVDKLNGLLPFTLLYELVLFFVLRGLMMRYVHQLDLIEKGGDDNNTPINPTPIAKKDSTKEEPKDLSYFR